MQQTQNTVRLDGLNARLGLSDPLEFAKFIDGKIQVYAKNADKKKIQAICQDWSLRFIGAKVGYGYWILVFHPIRKGMRVIQ